MSRYIIAGGVAAGMSAAARLRRLDEKAEIIVFEKGPYVSYANCGLPYYVSGVISDRGALTLQTPESFRARFNVDVRVNSEVTSIDRAGKKVTVAGPGGKIYEERYDKLVLAPGALAVRPPVPGIDDPLVFTLRTIPDTLKIREFVEKNRPKSAVIIGAGYIGLEMAENLHLAGLKVTVVEAMPQVLPVVDPDMAAIAAKHMASHGVTLMTGRSVASIAGGDGLTVRLSDGTAVAADMAVMSVGVTPDISLAKQAGLTCIKGICVDAYMRTSDPDIYAAGDAVEVYNRVLKRNMVMPLAGPANKQGRIVADNIVKGNTEKYAGTFGTSVVKVFDIAVAATGPSSRQLSADGIPYACVVVHPGSHAGYYPGASTISLKLMYSPSDGRILGAQAVGRDMAEKKIDVIAAMMMKDGTVEDLTEFEQCYAPPFSSAKDAVNMAGFVAQNAMTGTVKTADWTDVLAAPGAYTIIDVRTKREFAAGSAPGALNIPVDELRARLAEVPSGAKLAVYCGVGIRSYIACRILMQNEFRDVSNISGGYTTYAAIKGG